MTARIAALFRHPIKGFTPEKLGQAHLEAGKAFPGDRLFALENGPCGFDPAAPGFIPKQRFAVLAAIAEVAKAKTRFDDATGVLTAEAEGLPPLHARLATPEGRAAFAAWMSELLGEAAQGPLRLVDGAGWRFLDHPLGHISIINLASVRELGKRIGAELDPLRFRANVYVEGWDPWVENGWEGWAVRLGAVETKVFKPIVRCAAPGVDPATAVRDLDIPAALFEHYGHTWCGIYVQVTKGGMVREGDEVTALAEVSDPSPLAGEGGREAVG
jgi:MOSC domain-containing protein